MRGTSISGVSRYCAAIDFLTQVIIRRGGIDPFSSYHCSKGLQAKQFLGGTSKVVFFEHDQVGEMVWGESSKTVFHMGSIGGTQREALPGFIDAQFLFRVPAL